MPVGRKAWAKMSVGERIFNMVTRLSEYEARIAELEAENKRLREALEDAIDTIHSEFCGSGKHHPLCESPRRALEGGGG
jgi:hypothetical protein